MKTETLNNVFIDVCPLCQGIWLDVHELKAVIFQFTINRKVDSERLLTQWLKRTESAETVPKDFWQEDVLPCPRDNQLLRKHYFAGTKIGIDNCQKCDGFWIDGNEFKAIWEQVLPDPLYDTLGRELILKMQQNQKEREEMATLPARLQYTLVNLVTNPLYGLYIIGGFILRTLLDNENKKTT